MGKTDYLSHLKKEKLIIQIDICFIFNRES